MAQIGRALHSLTTGRGCSINPGEFYIIECTGKIPMQIDLDSHDIDLDSHAN